MQLNIHCGLSDNGSDAYDSNLPTTAILLQILNGEHILNFISIEFSSK